MNKRGFTLVELLAVLVVLGIVVGISIPTINSVMKSSKEKSEEAFVETIKDAMEIYLSGTEKKELNYDKTSNDSKYECTTISFSDVINSTYKPISSGVLVNPANEKKCNSNITNSNFVTIYHNKNHVYYYVISKGMFNCFDNVEKNNSGALTKNKINYISNFKEPEKYSCS